MQTKADADDIRREVAILELLRGHPNVVELVETFEDEQVSLERRAMQCNTVHKNTVQRVYVCLVLSCLVLCLVAGRRCTC